MLDSMHGVEQLRQAVSAVLQRRPEVLEAYLFGSQARGQAQAHSDVDVAVFVDEEKAPRTGWGLDAELATELMRQLGTSQVDVVVLNRAPPLLYHRVLRDGIRLFARDLLATTAREGRALSRYCDYLPQLRKMGAVLEQRILRGEFGK